MTHCEESKGEQHESNSQIHKEDAVPFKVDVLVSRGEVLLLVGQNKKVFVAVRGSS
jgi:hypothetical protein